ncbi:MAG: hypothetical protein AB7J34_24940 [Limisphaerales bacterium]
MNENFHDGDEIIPGRSADFSDAILASGKRTATSNPPPSGSAPAVNLAWHSPEPGADGVTPAGGVELADIGRADVAPPQAFPKPISADAATLRRAIFETIGIELVEALEAERRYGEAMLASDPVRGSKLAIDRLQHACGEAESLDEIRDNLRELALLAQTGPFSNSAIDRLLRRQWCAEVLPRAKTVADLFESRLNEFAESLQVEKRKMADMFGHLGITQMLGADAILAALRAELANFRSLLRLTENGGHLQGVPSKSLVRNFTNQ